MIASLLLLSSALAADPPRPPVAHATLLDPSVATALVGNDWGAVPTEALPSAPPTIEAAAATLARGDTVVFTARTSGDAPVVFVFADEERDPVCPEPLGSCVDVTGGWLAFGPFRPDAGAVELDLELPSTFHGSVLEAQAVVWTATGVLRSPVVTLTVTDPLPVGVEATTPTAEEAAPRPPPHHERRTTPHLR